MKIITLPIKKCNTCSGVGIITPGFDKSKCYECDGLGALNPFRHKYIIDPGNGEKLIEYDPLKNASLLLNQYFEDHISEWGVHYQKVPLHLIGEEDGFYSYGYFRAPLINICLQDTLLCVRVRILGDQKFLRGMCDINYSGLIHRDLVWILTCEITKYWS